MKRAVEVGAGEAAAATRGRLEVYLDSVLVLTAEDDALATGTIGFLSDANTGSRFDDVRVVVEDVEP